MSFLVVTFCSAQGEGDGWLNSRTLGEVHITRLSESSLEHSQTLIFMALLAFNYELLSLNVL